MAQIAVAGPHAGEGFLQELGDSLRDLGHAVTVECADKVCLPQLTGWAQTDLLVCAGAGCSHEAMQEAHSLRAIVSPVIGIDGIEVSAANARNILVVNGRAPENAQSMAEATIMLMLVCLYDLHGSENRLRQPPDRASGVPNARMLRGKTVGILGYGSIAQAVVARLSGWEASILIYSRRRPATAAPTVVFTDLDTVLRESDVLLILMSLNADSSQLLGRERLALMKRDAILINTSRGAIVDERALAEHVAEGRLASIALDVFTAEPLSPSSPLRHLPNAVLTPHCVGHTRESRAAIPLYTLRNVKMLLSGELPTSVCNPEVSAAWQERWKPLL